MSYIFLLNSIFQLILSIQITLNIGGNVEKYLIIKNNHLVITIIVLSNLILMNDLTKHKIKKLHKICSIKLFKNLSIKYLVSITLSSIWLIMFINAILTEHYKLLTPLLLLVFLIEMKRSQELKNE